MCGITGIFNIKEQTPQLREKALEMSRRLRHRGPDWSGIYCGGSCIMTHERLSIVDPQSGRQPLFSPDRKQVLAVNGEIYNHQAIREQLKDEYEFQTGSDCEVILALYRKKGIDFLEDISGIFAFALYDEEDDSFLIARRCRRQDICRQRAEGSGRAVRQLPSFPSGILLLQQGPPDDTLVQARLDEI